MPDRVTLTDRRVALRGLAAAVVALPALPLLAACDATVQTPGRAGRVHPTADASTADQALVATVARRVAGTRAAATALARHDAAHRSWLLGVASLHQQHLHRLGAGAVRPLVVKASSVTQLRAAEQQLQQALVSAAGRAESGALAQVLAAMAAAVAQRMVVA